MTESAEINLKAKDIVQAWREFQNDEARRKALGRILEAVQEPAQTARAIEQAAEAARLEIDAMESTKRDMAASLKAAEGEAEDIRAKARAEADNILQDATNKANEAKDIKRYAQVEASEIIKKANGEAGTILTQARAEADSIARDYDYKKTQLMTLHVDIGNAEHDLEKLNAEYDRLAELAKRR